MHRNMDARGMIAAVALGTVGALTIMIVPGFVMLAGMQAHLDDRQLGFVAAWDINVTALAIGGATFLIARHNWRILAIISLVLIAAGNVGTSLVDGYVTIIVSRILAGLGEGLAIGVSFAALGSTPNPDRSFAIYLVIGLAVSAAILTGLPTLISLLGSAGVFACGAGLALACLGLIPWLPANSSHVETHTGRAKPVRRTLAAAGLAGVFFYFAAQGAMWGYFERIGDASGISPGTIGEAMGLSSFAGVGGALLAGWLVVRVGRVWLLFFSGILSAASFWMLQGVVAGATLVEAGVLFNFAWNLAQPLMSGVCSDADVRGRVVVAMGSIQTIGFGLGPAMAAWVLVDRNFSPVISMSLVLLTIGLGLVLGGIQLDRRARATLQNS